MAEVNKLKNKEEILKKLQDDINKLPFIIEKMNQLLFKTGWFIDNKIIDEDIIDLLIKNNKTQIDCILSKYYHKNLKKIEKICIDRFPERRKIIQKAFYYHKKKEYEVSIVLFLTQIDGIFKVISNKSIFSSNRKRGPISWIEKLENSGKNKLLISALYPLRETDLLSPDFNNAKKYPNNIHRNSILHGYEINFGNRINSLKTISMINYVVNVIYNIVHYEKLFA